MPIEGLGDIDVSRTELPVRPLAPRRGLPTAFEQHRVLAAVDPEQLAVGIAGLVGPCRVLVTDEHRQEFTSSLHAVALRWVRIGYVQSSSPYVLEVPRVSSTQLVVVPVDGVAQVRTGNRVFELTSTTAACPRPGTQLHLERDQGGPVMIVTLAKEGLQRGVDAMLGRSPSGMVEFDARMDLLGERADRWQTALALLHSEISMVPANDGDRVDLYPLENFLITTLLTTQQSNITAELRRPLELRANLALRRAVDHIDNNLGEAIQLDDVATAARVSVRALQQAFRDVYDQTPTQYIRDRRLEHARRELLESSVADTTVTAVSAHWGYTNAGRFATAYRKRFSELPSETLRR